MKVDDLLDEFDFLCKEEKRDYLLKLWEKHRNEMMSDIFTKEIMMKMCDDMIKSNVMSAIIESIIKEKKGVM